MKAHLVPAYVIICAQYKRLNLSHIAPKRGLRHVLTYVAALIPQSWHDIHYAGGGQALSS